MTHLPPDDERWQEFLHQHRPTPPPASEELEEQLMSAIAKQEQPLQRLRLWAVPPAIAAGLLMAWSSYRILIPLPDLSNSSASLEAFLENNWNSVTGETSASISNESTSSEEWMVLANTAQ